MSQPPKTTTRTPALLLLASALFLDLNLFSRMRTPFLLGGDQIYFWMDAVRLLDGRRIYQDFLQFTPPGTDLVYFMVFRLFGPRLWAANVVVLVLGLVFVWLIYSTARRVMPAGSAMLASAVFLVPIYSKALNATHHWFGVLAVMAAVRMILIRLGPSRMALAGAMLGLASFFSLFHGMAGLLGFSVFLLWENDLMQRGRKTLLCHEGLLFAAYLLTFGLFHLPYLAAIGIRQLWYFQAVYPWKFVAHAYPGSFLGLPLRLTLHNVPELAQYLIVYLLLPAAAAGALCLGWIRRRIDPIPQAVVLLSLVALCLLGEVAMSPNWLRVYAVSAPAVILLVWVMRQWPKLRLCASIVMWVWVLVLASSQTISRHRANTAILVLPSGTVATTRTTAERLTLLADRIKPGEAVFQAEWPGIYLPLDVRNPLSFDTAGVVDMPRQSDAMFAVRQLDAKRVPYVLWSPLLDAPCPPGCSDRLSPLRDYLRTTYQPVKTLSNGETLWQRHE